MNQYEQKHLDLMRRYGGECAVLLKTDGAFPLEKPCDLALYGGGARRTVKGGTGSGEVNSCHFVTAEAGLEAAGFRITTKAWMARYGEIRDREKQRFLKGLKRDALKHGTLAILRSMGAVMPEPEYALPLNGTGDAAVYVLSRISGEGSDRKPVPGDILLTETEKRDILALNRAYQKFLLVLNVGGVVDLRPVAEVRNILLLSQLGDQTGNHLADLLLGRAVPSGKLATTWAAWGDYPSIGTFGDKDDTRYREGVYVGYRYFDSVGKKPLFPFGFGLSYTSFTRTPGAVQLVGRTVIADAAVRNTGRFAGKEVLQLYVSPPQGRLDKPFQALAAFTKTETLQPGETREYRMIFSIGDLASYDESRAAWVLEKGDYLLRLGNSSADTQPIAVLRVEEDITVRKVRNCLGKPDFTDWKPEPIEIRIPEGLPVLPISPAAATLAPIEETPRSSEIDPEAAAMRDEELCYLSIGAFRHAGSKRVVGSAAHAVAGAAGETASGFAGRDVPALVMADGPAGLRLAPRYTRDASGAHPVGGGMPQSMLELMPALAAWGMKRFGGRKKVEARVYEQNCTAIPIGTALAQSWNRNFARLCGDLVGDEMERFGVHLWLAPAMNLHRDIRCGRNFEYFSEDPLLAAKMAASITRGVQQHPGCGVTLKHFAANNQETNRYSSNSQVSERALRELYLRGFEYAIRWSQPHALMTSYNLINGVHTSEHRALLEDVLRKEFGYKGIVMTDWIISMMAGRNSKYPAPNAARIAAAGNDLTMPGGRCDWKAMLQGLRDGTLDREQLQINVSRILQTARKLTKR